MVTVSGSPLWNNLFPIIDFGAGASARSPSVRGMRSLVDVLITAGKSNRIFPSPGSTIDQRNTGIDGNNG
jgi:hypothetical protein